MDHELGTHYVSFHGVLYLIILLKHNDTKPFLLLHQVAVVQRGSAAVVYEKEGSWIEPDKQL